MNPHLKALREALSSKHGTTAEQLTNALFLIRAHRNLAGIVACCRHLQELLEQVPALRGEPAFTDQEARLAVLAQVAELDDLEPHLLRIAPKSRKAKSAPIWNLTGDSGLCDLLLIDPPDGVAEAHRRDFARISAWFAWQTFHHQAKAHTLEAYRAYLESEDKDKQWLTRGEGSRIYGAFRELRGLAEEKASERAADLAKELARFSGEDSTRLAILLRIGHADSIRRSASAMAWASAKWNLDGPTLTEQGGIAADKFGENLERFLGLIWLSEFQSENVESKGGGGAAGREIRRPKVELYGRVALVTSSVDEDGLQSGLTVDVFARPLSEPPPKRRKKVAAEVDGDEVDGEAAVGKVQEEQDPDEGEGGEPEITIYLADRADPVKAWYGSRSALHHMERDHAGLQWPHWRISRPALDLVAGLVCHEQDETITVRRGRLGLGLSLVCGRHLNYCVAVEILAQGPVKLSEGCPMAITLDDLVLHVWAGAPELEDPKPNPPYCYPHVKTLRLGLPEVWRPLIESLGASAARFSDEAASTARRLLKSLPDHYGVTPRGVSGALKLALLEVSLGDLGVVKAVTDGDGLNLANLIHYASYERAGVERQWAEIVGDWLGPLAKAPIEDIPGARVGSPQAFDPAEVRERIEKLKAKLRKAVAEKRWDAVSNNLTLYTSNWMALGAAGRASRMPLPGVVSPDGWILRRDKGRDDESTDRYLPLRETLIEQLRITRAFYSAMSILHPDFKPPSSDPATLIELMIFKKDQSVNPFQPKYHDGTSSIKGLPGNWARKLIRSEATDLPGRYKDAALGHWVQGRHPWSHYSTLPSVVFREQWLATQARLEAELGFEVIGIEGLEPMALPCPMPLKQPKASSKAADEKAPALTDAEIVKLLLLSGRGRYDAVLSHPKPTPESAVDLVKAIAKRLMNRESTDVPRLLTAACDHIRLKTKIPIFAGKPRRRFQCDWQVCGHDFQCYAAVTAKVIPGFESDLEELGVRPSPDEESDRIELGRLIMIAIWRLQLLCTNHLEAFLQFVASDRPVLAVNSLRLVELDVKSQRTGEQMSRTVLLEPYSAAFVTVERENLRRILKARADIEPDKRRYRWNAALRSYLDRLEVPDKITLAQMMAAAHQSVLLHASPVLAAYARGDLVTTDLGDTEFRRLAGLEPKRKGTTPRIREAWVTDQDLLEESEEALPADIAKSADGMLKGLAGLRSSDPDEWARVYRIHKVGDPLERLLHAFAKYQLETWTPKKKVAGSAESVKAGAKKKLTAQFRANHARNLEIVGIGLKAFTAIDEELRPIDDATLQRLIELTEGRFPRRQLFPAWSSFRYFLAQPSSIEQGFSVGEFSPVSDGWVSAKILGAEEMEFIEARLGSVASGIGTLENRIAAQRHFRYTKELGDRRGETEMLRSQEDAQGEMLRIQEYGDHTLKTAAATRTAPLAYLSEASRKDVALAREEGRAKLIDAHGDHQAHGYNFFDRVSRAIKEGAGDVDLGPHHLRHSKASVLLPKCHEGAVDFSLLQEDLPWVAPLLNTEGRFSTLLGAEGQCGQGLQAISALLGHLHPSTTVRHYTHTFCIMLYAYNLGLKRISLEAAFAGRVGSRATLFRATRKAASADAETGG